MNRKPRLLYLGHNLPYPPHEGALIRSYHTVRLLSEKFDLTGRYFFRRGTLPDAGARAQSVREMARFGPAVGHPIPQEWSRMRLVLDHLRSLASGTPYTRWMHRSAVFRAEVRRLIEIGGWDLVHVDSLDLSDLLPELNGIPVVLAHHNVESSLLRRRAEAETGLRKRYILHQADLMEEAERFWMPRVALNVVVSTEDETAFRRIAPEADTLVLPNGVDTAEFEPSDQAPEGGLLFVGGYSWFPNHDGMAYFAREILPLIRKEEPDIDVKWIGRAPDEAVGRFKDLGVEMLGYVEDIREEMWRARCVIVPLRVGGGTRLKILDAWSMGKAVVSTSRGCEGLEGRDGEDILIEDEPESFARAVLRVVRDERLREKLERGGRKTAENRFDWAVLGVRMRERYLEIIANGRP